MSDEAKPRLRTIKISRRRQITLPEEVLKAAKMNVGDELRVALASNGRLVLVVEPDPLDEVFGSMPGLSAATNLEGLRAEWDQ